jgi:hypothetical protein
MLKVPMLKVPMSFIGICRGLSGPYIGIPSGQSGQFCSARFIAFFAVCSPWGPLRGTRDAVRISSKNRASRIQHHEFFILAKSK